MANPMIATQGIPLERESGRTRVDFLKKVYALTFVGLLVSAASAFMMMMVIASTPALQNTTAALVIILGSWAVSNFICPRWAMNPAKEKLGFFLGSALMGVAMGYLLLTAMAVSKAQFANPYALIDLALLLTAATAGGLTLYVWTSPSDFKWAGAILSATFIPMLILMGVGFVFPSVFSGGLGIGLAGLFVVISVIGLLYETRVVMKDMDSSMVYPGALMITLGILILFWNILSLLMRLSSRN